MAEVSPLLAAIYERDNGRCRLCDRELKLNSKDCRLNHVVPVDLGGPDEFFNIQLSCSSCDQQRGRLSNLDYERQLYSKNRKAWENYRRAQGRRQTLSTTSPFR